MILHVVGARPNFVKIAPLVAALKKKKIQQLVIHTGQHYDTKMSKVFFDDLNLPQADFNLNIKSASSSSQIKKIKIAFEKVCRAQSPDLIVVPGDVNSSFACALVAHKLKIPLAHVEAGLRSFDETMAEENNRVEIDKVSDLFFVTERSAIKNLKNEGVEATKIFFCGNTMIDSLLKHRAKAKSLKTFKQFGLRKKKYFLMTMHRPSNVDKQETFKKIVQTIENISSEMPIIFPVHPRLSKNNLAILKKQEKLTLTEPLGYLDFLNLMDNAKLVLTDSGGVQEETTYLGVPCLTLRENTERPVTVAQGTNKVVGLDATSVLKEVRKIVKNKQPAKARPIEKWDGKASERIAKILVEQINAGKA